MKTNTATTTTTTTTTTEDKVVVLLRARARAREDENEKYLDEYLSPEACQAIERYWKDTIGTKLPPRAKDELRLLAACGMEAEVMIEAIDQTAEAPRPSWAYTSAILKRWQLDALLTMQDVMNDQRKWANRHKWG